MSRCVYIIAHFVAAEREMAATKRATRFYAMGAKYDDALVEIVPPPPRPEFCTCTAPSTDSAAHTQTTSNDMCTCKDKRCQCVCQCAVCVCEH